MRYKTRLLTKRLFATQRTNGGGNITLLNFQIELDPYDAYFGTFRPIKIQNKTKQNKNKQTNKTTYAV